MDAKVEKLDEKNNILKIIVPYDIYKDERVEFENSKALVICPLVKRETITTLKFNGKSNNYYSYLHSAKELSSELIYSGYYIFEENKNEKIPISRQEGNKVVDFKEIPYFSTIFNILCNELQGTIGLEKLNKKNNEKIFNNYGNIESPAP